ncbi:MAG: GntR family transcriptional regulator [Solirubrobacteraceae bacterium]|nr:GntR family transcriptional regulator [Solirubrobacteraceae bacterium]
MAHPSNDPPSESSQRPEASGVAVTGVPAGSSIPAGSAAPPEPPRTAVERVREYVRERVFSGEYADGTMLSEGQIAGQLGVSRTPVREAFVQLETQGFLRLYPKRGALVVPVSREDVAAVMDTRWVIERHGVEQAVAHPDPSVVARMRAICDRQQALLEVGDYNAFSDVDRELHRVLVVATGNPILIDLYDSLRDRQRRMVRGAITDDASTATTVLAEHRELVALLEAGKGGKALRLLEAHLDRTRLSPALLDAGR